MLPEGFFLATGFFAGVVGFLLAVEVDDAGFDEVVVFFTPLDDVPGTGEVCKWAHCQGPHILEAEEAELPHTEGVNWWKSWHPQATSCRAGHRLLGLDTG